MKKAFTKLASVLFLGCLAFWTIDAQAGCNDTNACNFVSTDVDALDCCFDNCVQIELTSGTFDSEISWNLNDGAGNPVATGAGGAQVLDLCLLDDCYTFEGFDSFGDGWNGATYIISNGGLVISSGTIAGSGGTQIVFVSADPTGLPCFVAGCTDLGACNFNSLANFDDSSCEFTSCAGCTDPGACNYDSTATVENGSCDYSCIGCATTTACNYGGLLITVDDGSCCFDNCLTLDMVDSFGDGWNGATYTITDLNTSLVVASGTSTGSGSTDDLCLATGCYGIAVGGGSFDSEISWTLNGADLPLSGVADFISNTFTVAGGICPPGCTDPGACNYDSLAAADDGTCCYDNCAALFVGGDFFDSEITFTLSDDLGNVIETGGAPFSASLCLADGCYQMEMLDAFGDGWGTGGWSLTDDLGNILASGTLAAGAGPEIIAFAIGGDIGCTDSAANNYDPSAICDDGSCVTCAIGEQLVSMNMTDSFGDGWNGATYVISDLVTASVLASGTIAAGTAQTDFLCLADGCYSLSVGGGTFDAEIGFSLEDQLGNVIFAGGAPFGPSGFPLGAAVCAIDGCTDAICLNYNPYASVDDGSCICPPDNNDCANASLITCGIQVAGTSINSQDNELLTGTNCGTAVDGAGVWYVFDGTGDQVFLSTCNTVSGFDTRLSIYEAAPDCSNLLCLGGNDDSPNCTGFLSEFVFNTTPGVDYYVLVHGFGGATGDFLLDVACVDCSGAGAINDDCVDAIFQPFGVEFPGNLCCVNGDAPDLCTPAFATPYGTWFVVNSGICDTFNFTLNNVSGSTVGMSVFEDLGNLGCGNIAEIACCPLVTGTCAGDLSAFFTLTANTDYYFFVYTTDPINCGDFTFQTDCGILGCTDPFATNTDPLANIDDGSCVYDCIGSPLTNDDCLNSTALPCGTLDLAGSLACATAADAPNLVAGCNPSPGIGAWYSFIGTGDLHTIRTCDGGTGQYSPADTQMDIYTSSDATCSGVFACIATEIDDNQAGADCGFFQADDVWINFVSVVGETYYIYVSGTAAAYNISHECEVVVPGCMGAAACNYDSSANADDGSCDYFSCLCAACVPGPGFGFNMDMTDAFGDGWNGATYSIADGLGVVVASGDIDSAQEGSDTDNFAGNELGDDYFCICDGGCYTLTVGGGSWDSEISFNLFDDLGNAVAAGGAGVYTFTLGGAICGCIDMGACNFDSLADTEDGSCEYLTCAGCTSSGACNFDSTATIDDASCCFDNCVTIQLTDSFGDGWNGAIYEVFDATSGLSVTSGTLDAGSASADELCLADGCYFINVGGGSFDSEISWLILGVVGTSSGGAPVTNQYFSVGAASCFACQEPTACTYNPVPPLSDCTLCEYASCSGCTYVDAAEYDSSATIDDGTCTFILGSPCPTDLNNDSITNTQDLLLFLGQFGLPC
ncbi:MAG: hypothetical protein ACI84C_000152 [Flavobacteriales bacterium]|jgi:hypothetical protein